jgi:hypothetical protein
VGSFMMYTEKMLQEAQQHELSEERRKSKRCPHDGHLCTHFCEGEECWRELNGS